MPIKKLFKSKSSAKSAAKVKKKKTIVRHSPIPRRPAAKVAVKTVRVRNSAVPPAAAKKKQPITHEMIVRRAYEISQSGTGGSEDENWFRAERELRGA